jgi:hypothetical protein
MPRATLPKTADGPSVVELGILDHYSLLGWQRSMVVIVTTLLEIAGKLLYKCFVVIAHTHKAIELTGFGLPLCCGSIPHPSFFVASRFLFLHSLDSLEYLINSEITYGIALIAVVALPWILALPLANCIDRTQGFARLIRVLFIASGGRFIVVRFFRI